LQELLSPGLDEDGEPTDRLLLFQLPHTLPIAEDPEGNLNAMDEDVDADADAEAAARGGSARSNGARAMGVAEEGDPLAAPRTPNPLTNLVYVPLLAAPHQKIFMLDVCSQSLPVRTM
jgi:hypothetical protein